MAITQDYLLKGGLKSSDEAANNRLKSIHQQEQDRANNDAKLAELIKGSALKQESIAGNQERARQFAESQGMKPGKYSVTASEGGFGVNPEQEDQLRRLQIEGLMNERDENAVRKLEKRSSDVGTAQAVPALQRGEEAIPGLFTGGKPELKSVGGMKNLAPNWAVPALEGVGLMPKGAGAERTALQELQNVKLYDSSGKAINENEMKRISDAMGLRGIFDPQEILSSLQQMGYTVLEKQKGVTAGAPERIVKKFEGAGGLAGKKTLADLIGATAKSTQSGAAPQSGVKSMSDEQLLQMYNQLKGGK